MDEITIALPKGKLGEKAIEYMQKIGFPTENVQVNSRTLMFEFPDTKVRYIICRSTDVPTFVEYGAADIGIVGKDTIAEAKADTFELVDLNYGYCKFVVALPRKTAEKYQIKEALDLRKLNNSRVATKFPSIAKDYFASLDMHMEIIKLHGNIELAPMVGLAEMIVDIVSTGTTLRENDLIPIVDIFPATARLIANKVSYRIKNDLINDIAVKLSELIKGDA
jgi:ATP phosphoribosyltransferase